LQDWKPFSIGSNEPHGQSQIKVEHLGRVEAGTVLFEVEVSDAAKSSNNRPTAIAATG
jgi:hypothetical protein